MPRWNMVKSSVGSVHDSSHSKWESDRNNYFFLKKEVLLLHWLLQPDLVI
jgi:hypothetical protein